MALWRAKDKPPVELVVANFDPSYTKKYNNDTIDKSKNMGDLSEPGVRT